MESRAAQTVDVGPRQRCDGRRVPPTDRATVSLRRSSGFNVLSSLLRLASALAAIPVLTHSLGLHRYGMWVVLVSILGLTTVLQVGLGPSVSFHVAQVRGDGRATNEVLGTSLVLLGGLGVVAGAILATGAQPLAALLFGAGDVGEEARAAMPFLGCAACLQFLKQWAAAVESGLQRYDVQACADGLGALFLHGGLMLLAALGHGMAALAAWWALATLGMLVVHRHLWRTRVQLIPTQPVWSGATARRLLHFGVRQWASQLGGSLFGLADRLVVNAILGPSAAALYSIATSVAVRINELSAAPVQVIAPALAATDSPSRRVYIYERAEHLNMIVAYGLAAAVMLGSEPLGTLLVPAEPDTMAGLLRIVALCYGAYSVNAAAFYAAQGLGRPAINAGWMLLAGLLFLAVLPVAMWVFGLVGAAWANLAFAVTLGINVHVIGHLHGSIREFVRRQALYLLPLGACFVLSAYLVPAAPSAFGRMLSAAVLLAGVAVWILRAELRGRGSWHPTPTDHGLPTAAEV